MLVIVIEYALNTVHFMLSGGHARTPRQWRIKGAFPCCFELNVKKIFLEIRIKGHIHNVSKCLFPNLFFRLKNQCLFYSCPHKKGHLA